MLANRFNESISDLRCQACYPHGLEKCQSCSSRQHCLADSGALQRASQWTRTRRCTGSLGSRRYWLVRIVSDPVLVLFQNVPGGVFSKHKPSPQGWGWGGGGSCDSGHKKNLKYLWSVKPIWLSITQKYYLSIVGSLFLICQLLSK